MEKKCENCKNTFVVTKANQKTCSDGCSQAIKKLRKKKYNQDYYKTKVKPNRILSEETKRKNRERRRKYYKTHAK